ncbi:MAG: hypothetical protein RLZZ299_417 [Pseudomonadota bacterium]
MPFALVALALTACTGGKDSAAPGPSTGTTTATATDSTMDTGAWVGPGTDTGTATSTDMLTSCNVSARKLCVEFVNYRGTASWCNRTYGTVSGAYAAGGCPGTGRVAGRCSIDGDADASDIYDVDATVYYYTGTADPAASCTAEGGTWSASR